MSNTLFSSSELEKSCQYKLSCYKGKAGPLAQCDYLFCMNYHTHIARICKVLQKFLQYTKNAIPHNLRKRTIVFRTQFFVSHFSFHLVASLHLHSLLSLSHTMLKSLSWQPPWLQRIEDQQQRTGVDLVQLWKTSSRSSSMVSALDTAPLATHSPLKPTLPEKERF